MPLGWVPAAETTQPARARTPGGLLVIPSLRRSTRRVSEGG